MTGNTYTRSKPLANSIFFGLFYWLFSASIHYSPTIAGAYMIMLILPGITFPVSTAYSVLRSEDENTLRIMSHLILSVGIYYVAVVLYSGDGMHRNGLDMLGSFCGSLAYQLITKLLINSKIQYMEIIVAAILSGCAFLVCRLDSYNNALLGLALFLWTVINGFVANQAKKRFQSNS